MTTSAPVEVNALGTGASPSNPSPIPPPAWSPFWQAYVKREYYERVRGLMIKAGMGEGDTENILANVWTDGFLASMYQGRVKVEEIIPAARVERLRRYLVTDQQLTRAAAIIVALGLKPWQVSFFIGHPDNESKDPQLEALDAIGLEYAVLDVIDHVTGQKIKIYPPLEQLKSQ